MLSAPLLQSDPRQALSALVSRSGLAGALDRVLSLPPGQIRGLEHLLVFEQAVRKGDFLPHRQQRERLAQLLDEPLQPRALGNVVGILNAARQHQPDALEGLDVPRRALTRVLAEGAAEELSCSPWMSPFCLGTNLAELVSSDPEALRELLHDDSPAALALRSTIPGALEPTGDDKLDRNQKDQKFVALMQGRLPRESRPLWEPLLAGLSPEWQRSRWTRLWLEGAQNTQLQHQHLSPELYQVLAQAVEQGQLEQTRADLDMAFQAIADPHTIVPTQLAWDLFEHGRRHMPQGVSQAASRFGQLRQRYALTPQDSFTVYTATHQHPDFALELFGELLPEAGVENALERTRALLQGPPGRAEEVHRQVQQAFPASSLRPRILSYLLALPGHPETILDRLQALSEQVGDCLPACVEAVPALARSESALRLAEPVVRALAREPESVGPTLERALEHLEAGVDEEDAVRAALGGLLLAGDGQPGASAVRLSDGQVVVGGVRLPARR